LLLALLRQESPVRKACERLGAADLADDETFGS
jgi:hypothetical protein